MRIVDLFCGVGGVPTAVAQLVNANPEIGVQVIAAIDIDQTAARVYAANHGITVDRRTLESVRTIPDADCWWLSPPCQPYTQRGRQRGEHDRRSDALENLIGLISSQRPLSIALENVPQFAGSHHHRRILSTLSGLGYQIRCEQWCPTQMGIPMRRKRFYLVARRDGNPLRKTDFGESHQRIEPERPSPAFPEYGHLSNRPLSAMVDQNAWADPSLRVDDDTTTRYARAMHVVNVDDDKAVTSCFTSAYGNSPVGAGSYLHSPDRQQIRRFSPSEVASLMGWHSPCLWPPDVDLRTKYRLLGNSLAIPAVIRSLCALM